MKVIVQWIYYLEEKKSIYACLLSSTLFLFNAPPFTWWNRLGLWVVSSLTQNIERLKQLHFTCVDTGWHSVPVLRLFLALLSTCLMGIFHALGWMHAILCMILIFSFCPGHWAFIQRVCVSVCDFFYAFMCVDLSAFEFECVYLHVLRDL